MPASQWWRAGWVGAVVLAIIAAVAYHASSSVFSDVLVTSVPDGEPALAHPVADRVLIVVVDGLRHDLALEGPLLPTLRALAARGASGPSYADEPTMTGAGVRTLMTGAPPQFVDAFDNLRMPAVGYASLLSEAAAAGRRVAV